MMCAGSESVLCTSAAGCGRRRRVVLRYYDITHAGGPRGLLLQQRAAAVSSFSSNNNVLPLRGCRAAVAKISSAQCDPPRSVLRARTTARAAAVARAPRGDDAEAPVRPL